ncbi:MAG: response regulator [Acidobacteria bacterium]|nr:response regulator [Acidobacteriota bacterium]MBI3661888.1 response regulator [Acidobacteriota bacterium]
MNRRVLVVDDAPEICELVQAVLCSAGMEVLAVTNSQEAASHLMREKFDAVFLDVKMPPPDGIELAGRARSSGFNQKTPIVMITGDADPAVQARAFKAGANFFLYKPLDRRRLLRILRVTQGSIQQERRRFQRVSVRCKAAVESSTERIEGMTLDMSLNGVLVQASTALSAGTPVTITVQLKPGAAPLRASGKVARVIGEDCMGIELANVNPAESERLQEFLLPLILAVAEEEPAPKK